MKYLYRLPINLRGSTPMENMFAIVVKPHSSKVVTQVFQEGSPDHDDFKDWVLKHHHVPTHTHIVNSITTVIFGTWDGAVPEHQRFSPMAMVYYDDTSLEEQDGIMYPKALAGRCDVGQIRAVMHDLGFIMVGYTD